MISTWLWHLALLLSLFGAPTMSPASVLAASCPDIQLNFDSDRYKLQYLSTRVSQADNARFSEMARQAGQHPEWQFVHIENTTLKQWNDKTLKDRELSVSLVNSFKQQFMTELRQNLEAASMPVAIYADYKSVRLILPSRGDAALSNVQRSYTQAITKFSLSLQQFPAVKAKLHGAEGEVADARQWFMGGVGSTAEQAAIAARMARLRPVEVGVVSYADPVVIRELATRYQQLQALKKGILGDLNGQSLELMMNNVQGAMAFKTEFFSVLRRYPAEGAATAEFGATVDRLFGVKLPADTIRKIYQYMRLLDTFAPAIQVREEVADLGLASAPADRVVVDGREQFAENTRGLEEVLALAGDVTTAAEREWVNNNLLLQPRARQESISVAFEQRMLRFRQVLERLGLPGTVRASGDDQVFASNMPLTRDQTLAIAKQLAGEPSAFLYRLTVLAPGVNVANLPRAEGFEKSLRIALDSQTQISVGLAKAVKQSMVFLHVTLGKNSEPVVDIYVSSTLNNGQIAELRDVAQKLLPSPLQLGQILNLSSTVQLLQLYDFFRQNWLNVA